MIKKIITVFIITLFCNQNSLIIAQQNKVKNEQNGRFLRGEKYPEYSVQSSDADFYIATNGKDNWSGTLDIPNKNKTDGPFATIERAKAAVRELKSKIYKPKKAAVDKRFRGSPHKYGVGKDILVLLREGNYKLESPLSFSAMDGGERVETNLPTGAFEYHKLKDYYVTYAAYPGEYPVITGGKEIANWKKEEHGIWSSNVNVEKIDELFINGERQTLARYPNEGFLSMAEQPSDPNWFKYKSGDIKNWKGIESGSVRMKVRWTSKNVGISKVDEEKQILHLDEATEDMLYVPPIYYIENVEALLDTGGEYYFNKEEGVLKIIPKVEINDMKDVFVAIPNISELLVIKGTPDKPVRNLRFSGLKFTITAPGGESTINLSYAKNCEILNNGITNVSGHAIFVGLGCYNNLISMNEISDVKRGVGIYNSGSPHPARWEDINSDNVITFNKIENMQLHSGGIATRNAIRSVVSHNYVTGTYSYGITVGSWPNVEESIDGSHLVEYNNVSFTNQGRDDEGGMAVYGLSHGSIVRNNLIHDVTPAETNENVGLFFQNMAKGWSVTDNIFYNLKQGELKYCASYPIDNSYQNNFVIEAPTVEPEKIITGKPKFTYDAVDIKANSGETTGKLISISATVGNNGATGITNVNLYIDGKVAKTQKFAVIKGNPRIIEFTYKFAEPGEHAVAIGDTEYSKINISGKSLFLLYNNLSATHTELPIGDTILISTMVENVRNEERTEEVNCIVDGKVFTSKKIKLQRGESKNVTFPISLSEGEHTVTVGEQAPMKICFYEYESITVAEDDFLQYCSGTAKPCEFDVKNNHYEITASGTDFLHAEDSYGALYLQNAISGNFIATVKVVGFEEGVSEWFRAGIFVRNDISKSNETEKGSYGGFLMFSTPKRHGAQWDQFGDGSSHNTKSYNYKKDQPFPVWLKIIREGNLFTGFYSYDGIKWTFSRKSTQMPKLGNAMDIGLAGGTNDQRPSFVVFKDFKLIVEEK